MNELRIINDVIYKVQVHVRVSAVTLPT